MTPTTLFLVRHAQTATSAHAPTLSGWADVPLTDLGRQQVRALYRRYGWAPFDHIVSSPLERTRATASGFGSERAIELCADLREIHCGVLEGVSVHEIMTSYPDLWSANMRQDDDEFRWPGGESYHELRARSMHAVETIVGKYRGTRVAVITHAGVITQVLGSLFGVRPALWSAFRPGNASITELSWDTHMRKLIRFDDRSHLDGLHVGS